MGRYDDLKKSWSDWRERRRLRNIQRRKPRAKPMALRKKESKPPIPKPAMKKRKGKPWARGTKRGISRKGKT